MSDPGRLILHADVDKMFFAVEALERPGLRLAEAPYPIVIGGDPRTAPRSIVTTANAAARALGISSGLSTAIARRRAEERGLRIDFIPPRHEVYSAYSRRLMDLLRTETVELEQCSIDEAALVWPHGLDSGPVERLRSRILDEIGLSVSFGLAANRLVAKIASEVAKGAPSHVCVVRPGHEAAFLAPLPVRALVGVGPKAEARLVAQGIATIGHLAALPLPDVADQFGAAYGRYLHAASRGQGGAELNVEPGSKSISDEHTFATDTRSRAELWRQLQRQAEEVARRLRREGVLAGEVAVKLRYADWETITRQQRLGAATDDPALLARGAAALMRRHWNPSRAVRLVGLRAARLQPPSPAVQLELPLPLPAPVTTA